MTSLRDKLPEDGWIDLSKIYKFKEIGDPLEHFLNQYVKGQSKTF